MAQIDLGATEFWRLIERVVFDPALAPFVKLVVLLALVGVLATAWRCLRSR